MKKVLSILMILCMMCALAACGTATPQNENSTPESTAPTESSDTAADEPSVPVIVSDEDSEDNASELEESKILIAYFSRADENYGVGVIEKGNTEIIAEMIAEETGGELFHIERDTPYPAEYEACTDEAKQEQSDHARPNLKADVDISDYDIIYLGYPTWWGDMPMPVYTFLEAHDWNGKTVIPFCTHAGSGLSNTETAIKDTCSGATVLDGLAVVGTTAQNNRDEAESSVTEWLEQIGQ